MFIDYMGDNPRSRLLDFLGDHPTSDYNVTEMAAKAGMTRTTAYKALGGLLQVGMVVHTRDIGQSRMYRLNTDHLVVQSILQADMTEAQEPELVTR